MKTPIN